MASAISDKVPPHRPSTRTGTTLASYAVPATPVALSVTAATVPVTWVPCQLEVEPVFQGTHCWATVQSPSSLGSASLPSPSRAASASLMKS